MIPNATVDILGSAPTVDSAGDEIESSTVTQADVPMSIVEKYRKTGKEDSDDQVKVMWAIGRTYAGVSIDPGMRLRDKRTGRLYVVDSVAPLMGVGWTPEMRLNLREIE